MTDNCCKAVHQTWALIIHPLADKTNYQAFCYNPSGQKVKHFLEPLLWQSTLNVSELWIFNDFQQLSGSLDFSGVLSICGAKKILDSLTKHSSAKISIEDAKDIKNLLLVSPPSRQEHFNCVEHTTQSSLKNSLVIIGLKRLLNRLIRGLKFYLIFLEETKDLDKFCVWIETTYNSLKIDFSLDKQDILDQIKEWDRAKLSSFFSRFETLTQSILQVRRTNNILNIKISNLN